jgi:NADPH-dependent ferric siderophore reductase
LKTASAIVRLANPAAVLEAVTAHLAEHDVSVRVEGRVARAMLYSGEAEIRIDPSSMTLQARAPDDEALEDVTDFLASHIVEFARPERPDIRWTGYEPKSSFADFREMRVVAVSDVAMGMRRVRLSGENLTRFAAQDNLHVRLFFPRRGVEPVWPSRGPDGLVQQAQDPALRPSMRKYTIRRIDAAAGWVDIDFVLHEDAGPGSNWARHAAPGDLVGMAGPGGRTAKPAGWMLLAGDETALPAIARILEALPQATTGHAVIEIEAEDCRIPLEAPKGIAIRWLHRSDGRESLAEAVRGIAVPAQGSRFCWAGAEFTDIQAIRHHWREDCGLQKAEQLAVAYWRKGVADAA